MVLLPALLAGTALAAEPSCWRLVRLGGMLPSVVARIERPADNLVIALKPERFAQARRLGVVAANGTFFAGEVPMADVLDSEGREHHPYERLLRYSDRVVDLGKRWALGRPRGKKKLAVVRGDQARETMDLYLGGAAILLLKGEDRSADNAPRGRTPGESFPPDILQRRAARTLAGLTAGGELLLVGVPAPGATPREAAKIMSDLGAEDAVMLDGGGAFGFAAGEDADYSPAPREDLNPTHLAARACR